VVLVALGVMSVAWMVVIAGLIFAQKLLPPRASIDVSVALAIVGTGILLIA
jgi:predicted metal-binding membrane protein